MTDDPNRRTLRQFQCRDYLWETFEQMSQELECSVDYLINEAMRHYARGQGRLRQTAPPAARPGPNNPPLAPGNAPPMGQSNPNARAMPPQMPNSGQMTPTNGQPRPPQMPPQMPQQQMAPQGFNQPPRPQGFGQPQPPQYGQPPRPPQMPQQPQIPQMPPQMPQQQMPPQPQMPPQQSNMNGLLFAVFEGQRYPINKDEFFIGRSNKSCDLIVKDPNVSRQHARIVRHQGQYWMIDMGSTNGIEFQGGRVDRRIIGEGDSFRICDHEIVFTYH